MKTLYLDCAWERRGYVDAALLELLPDAEDL